MHTSVTFYYAPIVACGSEQSSYKNFLMTNKKAKAMYILYCDKTREFENTREIISVFYLCSHKTLLLFENMIHCIALASLYTYMYIIMIDKDIKLIYYTTKTVARADN